MDDERRMLRHVLAALAYRTQKALRGTPPRAPRPHQPEAPPGWQKP